MSRRQKIILVAVGVVLVLLYSGAIAGGAGRRDGSASRRPGGLVGWLGSLVGSPPAARRADLSADCLAGTTLTVHGTCLLHVAAHGTGNRRVTLRARDAATVTARPPGADRDIRAEVKAGAEVGVTVGVGATDITVGCAGTAPCVLTLP